MRGFGKALGIAATLVAAVPAAISWAEAGCARRIVNKSGTVALVSRDGGPWVAIQPHRSQTIHYYQSGKIDVALTCGPGVPAEQASFRASFDTVAVIDRCTIRFGDGFFEDQLGGGFFARKETGPLALNNPRQGDLVIGPQAGSCAVARQAITARY